MDEPLLAFLPIVPLLLFPWGRKAAWWLLIVLPLAVWFILELATDSVFSNGSD